MPWHYLNQLRKALIYNDFLHYTLRLLPIYYFLEFRYEINRQKQSCRRCSGGTAFCLSDISSGNFSVLTSSTIINRIGTIMVQIN